MNLDHNAIRAIVKAVGLTNAGVFAGYTWSLSRATVPSILDYGTKDEAPMLAQWRNVYVDGATFSRPTCILSALVFGYLAYASEQSSISRFLFILAALANASGVPYALTFLRTTNGALSIRSKRLLGDYRKGSEPMCNTYANSERASIEREKDPNWTTRRLVQRWKWHNDCRTVVLILGTFVGALAMVVDSRDDA